MLDEQQIQSVRDAFSSILRADYISIQDLDQLKKLDNYYVDFFKNLTKVLQNQDSYINGRRGSGKTVLMMRSYYECLKTISPKIKETSQIFLSKKVLPIYIDLSQCKDIFDNAQQEEISHFEQNFIVKIVNDLQAQLKAIFDEKSFKLFKDDFSKLDQFNQIREILIEGVLLKTTKSNISEQKNSSRNEKMGAKISPVTACASADSTTSSSHSKSVNIQEQRSTSVQDFLHFLGSIRKESNLDAIYIFLDEFSDLSEEEQKTFSRLLKKLLGSKNNIFFKVGTITDRFDFGESILLGRDIYPISLDLNDFVERYGGIVQASKHLQTFTKDLIEKRLALFANGVDIEFLFGKKNDEIYSRISREAMGIPRTIGMILQSAFQQTETRAKKTISLLDVMAGIRETRKTYFRQFQGAVKKQLIPPFNMDLWNSLLKKALDEKNKSQNRPASHFMIDNARKKYLNFFCENFMLHCLEDSRASKYGGNYVLFAFDYDVCNENNIPYAEEKDDFTAIRFIYDSVLKEYDCYFSKERLRSYRCPNCGKIYDEKAVAMFKTKKRCFEDDTELEVIEHSEVPITEGNYTEIEVKILGIIATLDKSEAMSAQEISDAVGCSRQKVSNWCSKVLKRKKLISTKFEYGKNYYYNNEESPN